MSKLGSQGIAQTACISGSMLRRMGVLIRSHILHIPRTRSAAPLSEITPPESYSAQNPQEHKQTYQYPLDHFHSLGRVTQLPRFAAVAAHGDVIAGRPAKFLMRFPASPSRNSNSISRTALGKYRRIHLSSQTWHRRASERSEKERKDASQSQLPWQCFLGIRGRVHAR
jgi:hypothetical protein